MSEEAPKSNNNDMAKRMEGLRKAGIGITAIVALAWKPPADFRTTAVIGVIAVVGIICQTVVDHRKHVKKEKQLKN